MIQGYLHSGNLSLKFFENFQKLHPTNRPTDGPSDILPQTDRLIGQLTDLLINRPTKWKTNLSLDIRGQGSNMKES